MFSEIQFGEELFNLLKAIIVAIVVAFLIWLINQLIQRKKVKITQLYPNKIYPGMALGVRGIGFSPKIENNEATFFQDGNLLSVSGNKITGGSSAPRDGVLTIEIPTNLRVGNGKIAISNGISKKRSNQLDFEVSQSLPAPRLNQLGTDFASQRDTGIVAKKLIVIGGEGFALKEENNEIIFEWNDASTKKTKITVPSEVRGDALLGVEVPTDISPREIIQIKVRTNIDGEKSPISNPLEHQCSPPPKLYRLDKLYVQPKEELKIFGVNFDPNNKENNIIFLRPYQTRVPILCIPKIVTEKEITIKIPKGKNILPGPYDVMVEVHGVSSINSLVLDIQHKMSFLKKYIWH